MDGKTRRICLKLHGIEERYKKMSEKTFQQKFSEFMSVFEYWSWKLVVSAFLIPLGLWLMLYLPYGEFGAGLGLSFLVRGIVWVIEGVARSVADYYQIQKTGQIHSRKRQLQEEEYKIDISGNLSKIWDNLLVEEKIALVASVIGAIVGLVIILIYPQGTVYFILGVLLAIGFGLYALATFIMVVFFKMGVERVQDLQVISYRGKQRGN
jgi:hypothetical protein